MMHDIFKKWKTNESAAQIVFHPGRFQALSPQVKNSKLIAPIILAISGTVSF